MKYKVHLFSGIVVEAKDEEDAYDNACELVHKRGGMAEATLTEVLGQLCVGSEDIEPITN